MNYFTTLEQLYCLPDLPGSLRIIFHLISVGYVFSHKRRPWKHGSSIDKTYIHETLERKFHLLYKNRELRQEYSALRRIFNFLLGVWASRLNTVNVLNIMSFSRIRGDQQRWHSENGTSRVVQYTVFHLGKRARKYLLQYVSRNKERN